MPRIEINGLEEKEEGPGQPPSPSIGSDMFSCSPSQFIDSYSPHKGKTGNKKGGRPQELDIELILGGSSPCENEIVFTPSLQQTPGNYRAEYSYYESLGWVTSPAVRGYRFSPCNSGKWFNNI